MTAPCMLELTVAQQGLTNSFLKLNSCRFFSKLSFHVLTIQSVRKCSQLKTAMYFAVPSCMYKNTS